MSDTCREPRRPHRYKLDGSGADGPLRIGNYVWDGDEETGFVQGRIDEVKVWNVARTAAEVCVDAGGIGSCDLSAIAP